VPVVSIQLYRATGFFLIILCDLLHISINFNIFDLG